MKGPDARRVLVLAPAGRDAALASDILQEAAITAFVCADLPAVCRALREGAAVAVIVEEALQGDLTDLCGWILQQPTWSDFPFVVLTGRGVGLERNPTAQRLSTTLGNVTFLERPFHPTTLVSVVRAALRTRGRQYEARERIEEIRQAEALLERRVKERTAELEAANRELAGQIAERGKIEAALRQAQRLEAIGQLTSGVAHDFNNLLTVILGNVWKLQQTETDLLTLRRLDMMAQAGERGAKLTAQMLAFSRRQKLETKRVDLNGAVRGMRDLLQSTIGGSVSVSIALADDLWPALIDPTQVELVILNLAINARDAMEVGGAITISTANVTLGAPSRPEEPPPGEYVMVCVADNGPGMTAEVLSHAFEPFFTTKPVGKGSGLGLSQVYGLVAQSRGGVRIDTAPGEGVSVKVYLPRAYGEGLDDIANARAHDLESGGGALVLLVDDDVAVREVTRGMLIDLGYSVIEAGSGGAALDALQRTPDVDILLLDFAMPGMNGAEVAREARARRPGLPIVYATGYADTAALETEQPVVQKPFRAQDLALVLAGALLPRRDFPSEAHVG